MGTKTSMSARDNRHRRNGPHAGKGPKAKEAGHKTRGAKGRGAERLLEQPVSDSSGTVSCPICGHPVDPRRMHPHMVRFHGVAIRARGAWTQVSDPARSKHE